jgi:hypothetical protein
MELDPVAFLVFVIPKITHHTASSLLLFDNVDKLVLLLFDLNLLGRNLQGDIRL